jgi:hypothetical protein
VAYLKDIYLGVHGESPHDLLKESVKKVVNHPKIKSV